MVVKNGNLKISKGVRRKLANNNNKFDENIHRALDFVWRSLPAAARTIVATFAIFLVGSAMRGDWLLILTYFVKHFYGGFSNVTTEWDSVQIGEVKGYIFLKKLRLEGFHKFVIMDVAFSYFIYFGLSGFLHWWFYVRQRNHPETWKCQPQKWLTPELEKQAIKDGAKNIGIGSTISGLLACYIDNGGYTSLYFNWDDFGAIYFILSIPIIFLYLDAGMYYVHRILHIPYIYKRFHKYHHVYKQPNPFSSSAMHTAEFLFMQSALMSGMFLIPVNAVIYFGNLLYIYYYGIITHSGIDIKPIWPWQADVRFHDNHHQYFHLNYGFNLTIWDRFHGTYRQKDRVYSEEIFGGKGKEITDATKEEIQAHLNELKNEIKT